MADRPSLTSASGEATALRGWAVVCAAGIVTAVMLALWASVRGVDGDEGFYLAAGRYVAEGRRLYADVFYPQMPYLPWIEAAVFRPFGVSLAAGRGLSIAAAALSAAILTAIIWRAEQSIAAALIAAVLYVTHGVSLHMLCLSKTYGVTNLFLLAAFAPFALGSVGRPAWALLAGAAAGCAIGVRLPAAAVAIVLAALAWRYGQRPFLAFAVGTLIGSAGWLLAAALHPQEFWFCNVSFHSLRRETIDLVPIVAQKLSVIGKWIFLPQHLVLWALIGVGLWKSSQRRWPAALCAAVLAAALAAATPTYLQYMVHVFPFILLVTGPALVIVSRSPALIALVLGVYLLGVYPAVRAVPAESELGSKRQLWDRSTVFDVARFIQAHTAKDDAVLSWWEGYPVLSQRPGFVGVGFWESNVAKKLDPATAKQFHVLRQEEIGNLIDRRVPAVIVTTADTWRRHKPQIDAGYELAHTAASIEVYVRRDQTGDQVTNARGRYASSRYR